ncbi:MAG: hypothetical protein GF346_03670 [Candidatus Eisenbacteria bacterium]|nr:hypothetical protein [Candidatus Latescibacterota bacterium]MBD3301522.1 hypothetical protein [Candidatus Eisenbacteria bacterium]
MGAGPLPARPLPDLLPLSAGVRNRRGREPAGLRRGTGHVRVDRTDPPDVLRRIPALPLPGAASEGGAPMRNPRSRFPLRAFAALFVLATGLGLSGPADADVVPPEWVSRYDGPDHLFDRAHAVAVDRGCAYLTGESDSEANEQDLFVAKYDADGDLVFSARYDGPGHGPDRGLDLAVDADGAVLVVGQSWGGDASQYDLVAIKYGPDGTEQWVARYDGEFHKWERGVAIASDGEGGAVVTGWSHFANDPTYGEQYEYVTMRYDAQGGEIWTTSYTGPGPVHSDRPSDLAVDANGDVYVTGATYVLGLAWDFGTIKLRGTDGHLLWQRRYDYGIGGIDEAYAIALGGSDRVCVTGLSYTDLVDGRKADAATVAYDAAGNELWVARYDGADGLFDLGEDLAVDAEGHVYVTGHTTDSTTAADYLTIEYDDEGSERWVRLYDGPQSAGDYAMGIAVDPAGRVCVTGESKHGGLSHTDVVTLLYDGDGDPIWSAVHATPVGTNDFTAGVALDGEAGVQVAATSSYTDEGVSWDAVLLRYPGGAPSAVRAEDRIPIPAVLRAAPNPFSASTALLLDTPAAGPVRVSIHDAAGRIVRVLAEGERKAGRHRITWDGRGRGGVPVPAGVYYWRCASRGDVRVTPITRIR